MTTFEDFIELVPEHYKKKDTLKFLYCFEPIFDYINDILDDVVGKKSIEKAENEYLDYIGYIEGIERLGNIDIDYRRNIQSKRFIKNNAPTTKNLLELVKRMTGYNPATLETNKIEVASQSIKYVIKSDSDPDAFPDLNLFCDAGARIIQSILTEAHQRSNVSSFSLNGNILNQNIKDIEV